jgi:excisionase family DNA binding protein
MQKDGLLTVQDVSKRLQVPVETLRRWRREQVGPHSFKIGGQVRYRPESVERYLREQERKEGIGMNAHR